MSYEVSISIGGLTRSSGCIELQYRVALSLETDGTEKLCFATGWAELGRAGSAGLHSVGGCRA